MRIKQYTFFAILYIFLSGILFYLEYPNHYTVSISHYSVMLPVAIWMVVPIIIFFIFSWIHLTFFTVCSYLRSSTHNGERKKTLNTIRNLILNEKSNIPFANHEFSIIQKAINQASISNISKFNIENTENKDIQNAISLRRDIEDGKYRKDISSFNLDKENPLNIKNDINKITFERSFAKTVLKKYENYHNDIIKIAFIELLNRDEEKEIKSLFDKISIDKEMAFAIFKKREVLNINSEDTLFLSKKALFDADDFLSLADSYIKTYSPDDIINIFETLSESSTEAIDAYIYVLLELELIPQAKELIDNNKSKYTDKFKLYVDIKEHDVNCDISSFIFCK